MDFSTINPEAADSEGDWMHLRGPDGSLLYAKDAGGGKWTVVSEETEHPCRVKVLGRYSEPVQAVERKLQRKAMKSTRISGKDRDHDPTAEFLSAYLEAQPDAAGEVAAAAVVDWENIIWKGKPVDFDKSILSTMAERQFFRDQVREASQRTADFFGAAASG